MKWHHIVNTSHEILGLVFLLLSRILRQVLELMSSPLKKWTCSPLLKVPDRYYTNTCPCQRILGNSLWNLKPNPKSPYKVSGYKDIIRNCNEFKLTRAGTELATFRYNTGYRCSNCLIRIFSLSDTGGEYVLNCWTLLNSFGLAIGWPFIALFRLLQATILVVDMRTSSAFFLMIFFGSSGFDKELETLYHSLAISVL